MYSSVKNESHLIKPTLYNQGTELWCCVTNTGNIVPTYKNKNNLHIKKKIALQREENGQRKKKPSFWTSNVEWKKALECIKVFLCIKPKNTTSEMETKVLSVAFHKSSTKNALVLFMATAPLGSNKSVTIHQV